MLDQVTSRGISEAVRYNGRVRLYNYGIAEIIREHETIEYI